MNKEDKELLLKDLCGRFPYGVKLFSKYVDGLNTKEVVGRISQIDDSMDLGIINETNDEYSFTYVAIHEAKPYLFPLSSMTEEQKIECFKGTPLEIDKYGDVAVKDDFYGNSQYTDLEIYLEVIDWLNKNHFDYRGLIPKDLAIDATGLNVY